MSNWKEDIAQLPENERLELARELISSLNETNLNRFFSDSFSGRFMDAFLAWLKSGKSATAKDTELKVESEEILGGGEIKSWIYQQIAESESRYADEMANGNVKTYTLAELKAEFDG